jgi:hypothetical protein
MNTKRLLFSAFALIILFFILRWINGKSIIEGHGGGGGHGGGFGGRGFGGRGFGRPGVGGRGLGVGLGTGLGVGLGGAVGRGAFAHGPGFGRGYYVDSGLNGGYYYGGGDGGYNAAPLYLYDDPRYFYPHWYNYTMF